MEKSESIKELATALCNFQSSVSNVPKDGSNPFFKSKYATLSNILDVIREPLLRNNLSFVQFPTGEHELTTILMHNSGEWIQGTYKMTPTKNDPQGLGSVITYQRRYALGSILGLNIDDDDDGNAASKKREPENTSKELDEFLREIETATNREESLVIYNKYRNLLGNPIFDAKMKLIGKKFPAPKPQTT